MTTKMAAPLEESLKCSLSRYFASPCGKKDKFGDTFLFNLTDCDKKVAGHLRECKLSQNILSEGHLIALRAGIWNWTSSTDRGVNVCGAHRHQYGLGWRPASRCGFFKHNGSSCKSQRGMSSYMCELAQLRWGELCRVGTGICRQCLDQVSPCHTILPDNSVFKTEPTVITLEHVESEESINVQVEDTQTEASDPNHQNTTDISEDLLSASNSQQSTVSQHSNWSDGCEDLKLPKVNTIMKNLNISPLRSQLSTSFDDIKPSTLRYYKRKADESIDNILDLIAPTQGKLLRQELVPTPPDTESSILEMLIEMYTNTEENSLKTQLLSILSTKMTKIQLQTKFPALTSWKIDQARALINKTKLPKFEIPEKKKAHRKKMEQSKIDHAVDFFSDPAFIQLVSFGTKEMSLESGESITIPEVIRTTSHSKIIEMYLSYCKDTDFSPLGKSTLFKILNSCEAKKRSNLHGLDNITADGIDAFESLFETTQKLSSTFPAHNYEEINRDIKQAKSYLKADFKIHLEKESLCADHCLNWLLSDPTANNFQTSCDHNHTLKCDRCENLKKIQKTFLDAVEKMPNSDDKDEVRKSLNDALENIHGWKAHIIRTSNQDLFRQHILQNLKRYEGVLVMDWAMKFLPQRHREKQTDWFGQRGKHWHVSVVIYRDEDGEIGHRTFTHVLENVKQDWYAVASLMEHTLNTVKIQLPHVTDIYLRSDNAGCYHCGHLWLTIPKLSDITGINIKQYTYSEAQAGKSYCDSKIAHMRTKMRSYVANGSDILCADDMKTAIDHGSGVTGCQVAYVEIDTKLHTLKSHPLKNISQYNDVIYTSNGEMILRKQYNIGDGLAVRPSEYLTSNSQQTFGCKVIRDFNIPSKFKGQIRVQKTEEDDQVTPLSSNQNENANQNESIASHLKFECPETGCVKSFASHRSLDNHLIAGNHQIRVTTESTYDLIKKQWAELCNNVVVIVGKKKINENQASVSVFEVEMGYGLKKPRKINRFSAKIKEFLEKKFEEGEKTGKKCLPKDVETEMKRMRDDNGNRVFPIEDCLTSSQILSYFSRLSAKKSNA